MVKIVFITFGILFITCCQSETLLSGKLHAVAHLEDSFYIILDRGVVKDGFAFHEDVKLIMVETSIEERERKEFAQKSLTYLFDMRHDKVNAHIISQDEAGYSGFVDINNQDIAILLLEKGYIKVDEDSKYISKYPEKFQQYMESQSMAKKKKVGLWQDE
ncbi:thermonuclease family protein [Bacillus carboniphilus]|uniref:Thermonuclease family protein n=1 Tax=Bacillus carboniphilus TaxID=86663 RepID=A0ABY9K0B2_9BACI|nr:thermonuclease family protein [Bacillus carboniphilus]WLR44158.1 thermonuclease family protein [Bacillus carboniphilus]